MTRKESNQALLALLCPRNWKYGFLLREAISLYWTSAIRCLHGVPELFLQQQKSWCVKSPPSAMLPLSWAGCWHRLFYNSPLYFLRSLLVTRDWTLQFLFFFFLLVPPPFLLDGFKDIWGAFLWVYYSQIFPTCCFAPRHEWGEGREEKWAVMWINP